jgi:hypothetical protein
VTQISQFSREELEHAFEKMKDIIAEIEKLVDE